MTQENKDLLLRDLCGRLPYGVKCQFEDNMGITDGESSPFYDYTLSARHLEIFMRNNNFHIKPYLRLMSSMTDGEQKILEDFVATISPFSGQMHVPFDEIEFPFITMQKIINYLYSIHIDINGMIPKGLAIEVTEDNNPYKD